MSQININSDPTPTTAPSNQSYVSAAPPAAYDSSAGAKTAASNNLTWAIAVVLIIAAIAIAVVYVSHNIHF